MTIKIEDIHVGDELGFKPARVTVVGDEGVRVVFGEGREAYEMPIPAAIVSTHTPAPREFRNGDEVRNIAQFTNGRFFVIATFGEWAWVRDANNWTTQFRISDLRHAAPRSPRKSR